MAWYTSTVTLAFSVDAEDESEADMSMLGVFMSMPFGFNADIMGNTSFVLADDGDDEEEDTNG